MSTQESEQEFLAASDKPVAVYNEFRAQMAELKEYNEKAVFDYRDAKGNKEARSHVYKLRKTKTAIDAARKDAKAAALAYGRKVDAEAAELVAQIEAMIDVHQKPLDEIEEAEARRVGAIKERIEKIEALGAGLEALSFAQLSERLTAIEAIVVDETFAEFLGDAAKAHDLSLLRLRAAAPAAQKREAEAKELEDLRKLKAENDARLAREAAEKEAKEKAEAEANARAAAAAKAAEEQAKREQIARMQAEERAKEAEERAEREKAENAKRLEEMAAKAKQDAEDAAKAAEARVKAEQEAKEKAEAEAEARRESNKKHVASVNLLAAQAMVDGTKDLPAPIELGTAVALCEMVSRAMIPGLSINY